MARFNVNAAGEWSMLPQKDTLMFAPLDLAVKGVSITRRILRRLYFGTPWVPTTSFITIQHLPGSR